MSEPFERWLWPNIGAEEGDPRRVERLDAVIATRRLWGGIFDDRTGWLEPGHAEAAGRAASGHPTCALRALEGATGIVPWLADADAHERATEAGRRLYGAPADVVSRVHDKAFAVAFARAEGFDPPWLGRAIEVYDAAALTDAPAFARAVQSRIDDWPAEARGGRFVIKPRLGTTGRGQLRGVCGSASEREIARHAAIWVERGGVVLEPWLERSMDLSVVLHVEGQERAESTRSAIQMVAGLRPIVSERGAWRGHLGEIDRQGRIWSGTAYEEPMREAAAAIAGAARERGFSGPCGLDGFAFTPPGSSDGGSPERLRPIVELNARFTLGHVCAGWARRALEWLVRARGLQSGRRVPFLFALAPPRGVSSWGEAVASPAAGVLSLPFPTPTQAPVPDDRLPLDPAAGDAGGARDADTTGPALVFDVDGDGSALRDLAAKLTA